MYENMKLSDLLTNDSQDRIATALGLHQTTISKYLRQNRQVYVAVAPDGEIQDAFEIKKIGRFRK